MSESLLAYVEVQNLRVPQAVLIHTVEQFASMNDETYDNFVTLHLSNTPNLRRAVNILRQATKLMMIERVDKQKIRPIFRC